jgi:hypothetical protein
MSDAIQPTLPQGNGVLNLILEKKASSKDLQTLFESGVLSDVLGFKSELWERMHPNERTITRARVQYALGMLPEFKIVGNYYLKVLEDDPAPRKSILMMLDDREVKYDSVPDSKWTYTRRGNRVKSRSAFFSLIRFPIMHRSDNLPDFTPAVVLKAVGYINSDVYDLIGFEEALKTQQIHTDVPIVALNATNEISKTGWGGEKRSVSMHPSLQADLYKKEIWFKRDGLSSDDYWLTDHLFLVRYRIYTDRY